jgi:hypothetical protein
MKDTIEMYDPHDTEGVRDYEKDQARRKLQKERNGAAALAIFVPLWSATDPKSRLSRFLRFAPLFCVGAPIVFATAVALGYI